jgi:plasmid replication initiation protein
MSYRVSAAPTIFELLPAEALADGVDLDLLDKHSAIVQISNRITAQQRKAFNACMLLAADALKDNGATEFFNVDLTRLKALAGIENNNNKQIEEMMKGLVNTVVEFNVLGKDSYDWKAVALLSEAGLKNGDVEFAFAPSVRHALKNPKVYARISLSVIRNLSSKYSIALYEIARDYCGAQIPRMDLDAFRTLMGLDADTYPMFYDLKRRVLDPAVEEINKKTDIAVNYELFKQRKKVVGLRFQVIKRDLHIEDQLEKIVALLDERLHLSSRLMDLLRSKLKEEGFEYAASNIRYAQKEPRKDLEAFIITALQEDFAAGLRAREQAEQ